MEGKMSLAVTRLDAGYAQAPQTSQSQWLLTGQVLTLLVGNL